VYRTEKAVGQLRNSEAITNAKNKINNAFLKSNFRNNYYYWTPCKTRLRIHANALFQSEPKISKLTTLSPCL